VAYLDRVTNWLPAALLIFLAGAFLLPSEAAYSLVFYLCVLPALVLERAKLPPIAPATWLALALIAWSALTLAWGEDPGHRALAFGLGAASTAALVLALADLLASPHMRRRMGTALIWLGTGNAACMLLAGMPALLHGERMLGWGITRHPVLGGSVMAVAFLTAFWRAICERQARGSYSAAAAVMGCFVLAMQSRGAVLGAAGGLLLVAAGAGRKRGLPGLLAVLAALALVLLPTGLWAPLLARGTSHRFEIWQAAWTAIRQRPVFGWGLAAKLPPAGAVFPHSLYLSLLYYSGMAGLALFAAIAALVTARLVQGWRRPEGPWLAALWLNGLLAGLTDFGQITKGPGEIWFIIWLPIMLALAAEECQPTRSSPGPSRSNQRSEAARWGESASASAQKAGL